MKIKAIVSLFVLLLVLTANINCSYGKDVQGKAEFNKEFNELQATKIKNIEDIKKVNKEIKSNIQIKYDDKKFTFDVKNENLETVVKELCKKSNIDYIFPDNTLLGSVSLKENNKTINEVLDEVFAKTDYSYEIKDKTLLVSNKNYPDSIAKGKVVKEVRLKYITTKEALKTLNKLFTDDEDDYNDDSTDLDSSDSTSSNNSYNSWSSSSYKSSYKSSYSSSWNKSDETKKIKVSASEQTNSIILVGEKAYVAYATEVISKIDFAPTKIMIQCIMTTLDSQASKQIGAALSSFRSGTINSLSYDPLSTNGLTKFTYGVLDAERLPTKFSVVLDDLIATSKAKIIAKPYTVVKSGKLAKVSVGNTSYIMLTSQGAYTITQNLEKVDTGTNMAITPTLLDDGLVSMDIAISDSYMTGSPEAAIAFYTNTSKATTNITVKNGETIVIGGLNNRSEGYGRKGIPLLSFIPFLGYKENNKKEREVVFFITPYVLTGSDTPKPDNL